MPIDWDKTKPTGSQPGYLVDDAIRDTRAGVEMMLGTEHDVDVSDPTNPSATHKNGFCVTDYIADKAVTAAKIADNTITATQIAANAIGASELADNAVDTGAIANSAVTTEKIADGAVTTAKMANYHYLALDWHNPTVLVNQTGTVTQTLHAWAIKRSATIALDSRGMRTRVRFDLWDSESGSTGGLVQARLKIDGSIVYDPGPIEGGGTQEYEYIADVAAGAHTFTLELLGDIDGPGGHYSNASNSYFIIDVPQLLPLI